MSRWTRTLIAAVAAVAAVALAVALAGCNKSSNPSCSLEGGTQLATAPWPKFRADTANTGRALNVEIASADGIGGVLFERHCSSTMSVGCRSDADCFTFNGQETCLPKQCSISARPCGVDADCPSNQVCVAPIGPVATTPIVGPPSVTGDPTLYLGSTDGFAYIFEPPMGVESFKDPMQVLGAIVGSPLLGLDGTLFVPGNGQLAQFNMDGSQRNVAVITGFIAASPNIWDDGTVYLGTQSGLFNGVCPNGVGRFAPIIVPPTQSSAAVVQDPNTTESTSIEVFGTQSGQVHAFNIRGRTYWSFFTSASVVSAVVVDETTNLFYVADTSGRVFSGQLTNGKLAPSFSFAARAGITASMALGRDNPAAPAVPSLYVADESGMLYALDRSSGAIRWTFQADGPISSSPAVATGGPNDVIVLAADILEVLDPNVGPVAIDGLVYAVRDDGDHGTVLWTFDAKSSIGSSSPAIGADGTVYIGRAGSRLGSAVQCPDRNGDGQPDPCVVNEGGALLSIPLRTPNQLPTPTATP